MIRLVSHTQGSWNGRVADTIPSSSRCDSGKEPVQAGQGNLTSCGRDRLFPPRVVGLWNQVFAVLAQVVAPLSACAAV